MSKEQRDVRTSWRKQVKEEIKIKYGQVLREVVGHVLMEGDGHVLMEGVDDHVLMEGWP